MYCQIWHQSCSRAAQNVCTKTQTCVSVKEIGMYFKTEKNLKLWQNKKGQIFVWAAPKMGSFSNLLSVKKDIIFGGHLKQIFGPSYFARALAVRNNCTGRSSKGVGLGGKVKKP